MKTPDYRIFVNGLLQVMQEIHEKILSKQRQATSISLITDIWTNKQLKLLQPPLLAKYSHNKLTFNGIIKCLKGYYRNKVIRKLIAAVELNHQKEVNAANLITFLDCIFMLKSAWTEVKATISNCFSRCGFQKNLSVIEDYFSY